MCLFTTEKLIERFKSINRKKKSITCYKVLINYNYSNCLYSPYQLKEYHAGWMVSNFSKDTLIRHNITNDIMVNPGIHVYTNMKTAKKQANNLYRARVCKITCYLKDFIGYSAEHKEAAFTKVYLTKREYQKAVKGK